MDDAALYGFDVRGYTVLPGLLDATQLAVLNAEVHIQHARGRRQTCCCCACAAQWQEPRPHDRYAAVADIRLTA